MRVLVSIATLLLSSGTVLGQAPGSDIYVGTLSGAGTALRVAQVTNVTARKGYDNQPSFTTDGQVLLYTAIADDGQADIWQLHALASGPMQLTHTPESEYSPTVTPDGEGFSVIRVEADSTQRLWRFALDGMRASLILRDIKPVGYHAWADANTLALFVLGNPATLQIADTRSGTARIVAANIGRSLHKIPGRHAVSFLHLTPAGDWITAYDVDRGAMEHLAPALEGNEFYAWTPDGTLISGEGSRLFAWNGAAWEVFADLGDAGVHGISRIAVSPDGTTLAVVAADG